MLLSFPASKIQYFFLQIGMDNINYNPDGVTDDQTHPSGKVSKTFKDLGGSTSPSKILRQISTNVDSSSILTIIRKWSGVILACIALLLVILRWAHQEKLIRNTKER